jgi:hypothetical protein
VELLVESHLLKGISSRPHLSFVLASAVRSRKSIADLSHTLSLPSAPLDEAAEVLYHTISILEDDNDGLTMIHIWEFLGVVVEVYRYDSHSWHRKRA